MSLDILQAPAITARGFFMPEIPRANACRCCGHEKSLDEFAKKGNGKRAAICKPCDVARNSRYRADNKAKINAARRERRARNPERYRAAGRAGRAKNIDVVRKQNAEAVRRYAEQHPERVLARKIAARAERRGEITRPETCEVLGCNCSTGLHRHHPDYSKPREVLYLCRDHHETVHHRRALPLKPGGKRRFARAPKPLRQAAYEHNPISLPARWAQRTRRAKRDAKTKGRCEVSHGR
jgi:hypothetical protein